VIALTACRLVRFPGRILVVEQNTLSEAAKHGKSRRDRLMPPTASSVSRGVSWTISRGSRVSPRRSSR
jgi:hypothetical protein